MIDAPLTSLPNQASYLTWTKPDRLSVAAAIATAALGMIVLFGWMQSIEVLKRVHPGFVAMNPATAIGFILSGAALAANQFSYRKMACTIGCLVLALGTAKLIDTAFGVAPIDQVIFSGSLNTLSDPHPNRMAPNTAFAFVLLGLALCASTVRAISGFVSQAFCLAFMLIAFFALVGYMLGIEPLRGVGPFIPMALPTSIAFIILAVGVLCQSANTGIVSILRDHGPAGSMLRIALPVALVLPVPIAAARLWGQRQGYYGTESGIAIQVVANIVITAALLLWSVAGVYRKDLARNHRERTLRDSEKLNRAINDLGADAVTVFDGDRRLRYANETALQTFGVTNEEELGLLLQDSSHAAVSATAAAAARVFRWGKTERLPLSLTAGDGQQRTFETELKRIDLEESGAKRLMISWRDLTDQKRIEEQALWSSSHDELTKLPNRAWFQQKLEDIASSTMDFALLLIDIDDFKQINDSLGHEAGDSLLRAVASRVAKALRPEDLVARLGGDEFGVVLHRISTADESISAATKIIEQLKRPWVYRGCAVDCRVSIGVTIARLHGRDPSELLRNTDLALYAAKSASGQPLTIYAPEVRLRYEKRSTELRLAQAALDAGLIFPFYQPKIELRSGKVVGFEALLRWRSQDGAIEPPVGLAAAFEDPQLARQMTESMLTRVVEDMKLWLKEGVAFGHVALNATALDLGDGFADQLLERLDRAAIPRDRLQVEVTETVFLGRSAEYVQDTLERLSEGGIKIALDDFGTGFSSLSHLRQLPIDIVKIDRSFLKGLEPGSENAAIVGAVVGLGRNLRLDVVAEGIESAEQERYLVAKGCRYGQGFLYSAAVPAMRVPSLLRKAAERMRAA